MQIPHKSHRPWNLRNLGSVNHLFKTCRGPPKSTTYFLICKPLANLGWPKPRDPPNCQTCKSASGLPLFFNLRCFTGLFGTFCLCISGIATAWKQGGTSLYFLTILASYQLANYKDSGIIHVCNLNSGLRTPPLAVIFERALAQRKKWVDILYHSIDRSVNKNIAISSQALKKKRFFCLCGELLHTLRIPFFQWHFLQWPETAGYFFPRECA